MVFKDRIIRSVSEYLVWVEETNSVETVDTNGKPLSFMHKSAYYRGHSCECWELKPSILRGHLNEHNIIKKASLKLWNETSQFKGYLEKLIFFQHYGLCTRLLDVTFNPLVALYFACCDKIKHDCKGVVYCGYRYDEQNLGIAELTAKYVFMHDINEVTTRINNYVKNENACIDNFKHPLFILPPVNNPRIEVQNGAFIMSPLIDKSSDVKTIRTNRQGLEGTGFFDERRATIECNCKGNILHELSVLGIDYGTIYTSIDAKLKAIIDDEKRCSNLINSIKL